MKTLLFLLSLSLVGCGGLTRDEASVRVLRKSDAPKDCQEAGRVSSGSSTSDEEKEDDLKKETHKINGNTVVITKDDEKNILHGIAYKCP